jgi:hypothetical protein
VRPTEFKIQRLNIPAASSRPIPNREGQMQQDAHDYVGRYHHLEDLLTISPDEKAYYVSNGVRFRNRIGKMVSSGGWGPRRLRLRAEDAGVVTAFFRRNPHCSASDLLNVMQWCDAREFSCGPHTKPYEEGFYIFRGRNAGFLVRNLGSVLRSAKQRKDSLVGGRRIETDAEYLHGLSGESHPLFEPVKRQYVAMRRRFRFQRMYDPRELFDGDFNCAARLAEQLESDPYRFVETQFEAHKNVLNGDFPPAPYFLHRMDAPETFQHHRSNREQSEGQFAFEHDVRVMQEQIRRFSGKDPDAILADRWAPMKAYIRVMFVSDAAVLAKIQECWGKEARNEVLYKPSLEHLIRKKFPARFPRFAIE